MTVKAEKEKIMVYNDAANNDLVVYFDVMCRFNHRVVCRGQKKGLFHCPIQDARFTALLDFVFEGHGTSEIGVRAPRDPKAIKNLKAIEITAWFDNDFKALDYYGEWKLTGQLRMTSQLCRDFKRAWARYFVRYRPHGQQKPTWMKGYSRWQGVSLGYQAKHDILLK